jgi:hypothetical protein
MKGEKLRDVIEVTAEPPGWPTYYVVTDSGLYEYTGQTFEKRNTSPEGHSVEAISECFNRVILEVRGDGESAVILLDSLDMIVFDLAPDPFGPEPQSWPTVRFCSAAAGRSWKDEYDEMNLLF